MPKLKAMLFAGLAALGAALLSACSPISAINLLVPREGYDVRAGLAYGPDPRHKLDVYVPQGLNGPAPVLLFFYGGAWSSGDRSQYLAFGQSFASKGIVTVVADYRLYPQVKYPAFAQDAALALAWVHAHAREHGGDPARIFVSGHSAGAYNAVMLASAPKFVESVGGTLDWIAGVIGIAGPYDFLPLTDPDYIEMFHGANNRDAMPVHHVDGKRPPMLLITGTDDRTVRPGNSDRMALRLKAHGSAVQVIKYPGIGHVGIILSLAPGFRGKTTLREDMLRFIQSR